MKPTKLSLIFLTICTVLAPLLQSCSDDSCGMPALIYPNAFSLTLYDTAPTGYYEIGQLGDTYKVPAYYVDGNEHTFFGDVSSSEYANGLRAKIVERQITFGRGEDFEKSFYNHDPSKREKWFTLNLQQSNSTFDYINISIEPNLTNEYRHVAVILYPYISESETAEYIIPICQFAFIQAPKGKLQ